MQKPAPPLLGEGRNSSSRNTAFDVNYIKVLASMAGFEDHVCAVLLSFDPPARQKVVPILHDPGNIGLRVEIFAGTHPAGWPALRFLPDSQSTHRSCCIRSVDAACPPNRSLRADFLERLKVSNSDLCGISEST